MKKWLPIVHPILFTLFFILALYAANANEVSPSEVVIPLIAAIGFALLLFFLAVLLIGLIRKLRKGQKSSQHYKVWDIKGAAIVASIFMVLFFTFGHALISIGEWDQMHRTLLPNSNFWITLSLVWIGLLAISIYLVVMTRRDLYKISIVLNILSFTLVIISTITILIYETNHTTMQVNKLSENMGNNTVDLVKPDPLPDIYYIVLDRYANARTLEEVYDYDNSEFINHLSDEGFYVANDSVSNYDHTDSSLISSLNMDFIQNAMAESPNVGNILDYRVWHYLKPNGYTFIHFGSWYESTRKNPYADININYYAMPEFSSFLFQTTWAYPWCLKLGIIDEWWETQYNRVIYKFDKLAEIPDIEEPTFVFAHMLIPHPPYVFNSDSSRVTMVEARERSEKVQYVNQLIACNNMLTILIDEILSKSDTPPIIILQADEGPYPGGEESWKPKIKSVGYEGVTDEELRIKYGILNAYCLPNVDSDSLYSSITPVNSFRLVLNLYFDADFELLPDRSYAPYKNNPSSFFEVTDKVKYD